MKLAIQILNRKLIQYQKRVSRFLSHKILSHFSFVSLNRKKFEQKIIFNKIN